MQPEECHLISQALLTRIEVLEEENKPSDLKNSDKQPFCIEQLQYDDNLVQIYTGFSSFCMFLAFFQLLSPAVDRLNYWGSKDGVQKRHRLDVKNQLFLVLVKLKLNFKHKDLAVHFTISVTQDSRYITTWICFLHKELKFRKFNGFLLSPKYLELNLWNLEKNFPQPMQWRSIRPVFQN